MCVIIIVFVVHVMVLFYSLLNLFGYWTLIILLLLYIKCLIVENKIQQFYFREVQKFFVLRNAISKVSGMYHCLDWDSVN